MSRKALFGMALAAVLGFLPATGRSSTTINSGDIGITGTVDQFAEWASVSAIAASDFDGHINAVNQTRTAHEDLTIYSNITVAIAATSTSGSPDYNAVLTDGSGTYTLDTQFKITGAAITGASGFLDSAAFIDPSNTYSLTHTAGTGMYTVTLTVTMASPAASAPEAGNYSCGVVLTATW